MRPHILLSQQPDSAGEQPGVPFESVRLAGTLLNFKEVNDLYGPLFTGHLLDQFALKFHKGVASTLTKRCGALRRWLRDLDRRASQEGASSVQARTRALLINCEMTAIAKEDFADALDDLTLRANDTSDRSLFSTDTKVTRRVFLEALSGTLRYLAPSMGWPKLPPLKCTLSVVRGATLSIGELPLPLGKTDSHSNSGKGAYAITVARNKERLDRLRKVAEDELLKCHAIFSEGQKMLARKDLPSAADLLQAHRDLEGVAYLHDRKSSLQGMAAICYSQHNPSLRLASFLKHIVVNLDGRLAATQLGSEIRHLATLLGGPETLICYLEASDRALVAAYTIVMIDSAFNVQPCDDLAADPFVGEAVAGKIRLRTLSSLKNRPSLKEVKAIVGEGYAYLAKRGFRLSTKDAIDIWLEMSAPIRRRAIEETAERQRMGLAEPTENTADDADDEFLGSKSGQNAFEAGKSSRLGGARVADWLWILPTGINNAGRIRKTSSGNFRDWWKSMLADHANDEVIGGIDIRRRNIRPTILQLSAAGRNGDGELAAILADHESSSTTFNDYLNRPYMRLHLAEQIRNYQDLLQAAIIANPEGKAVQLKLGQKRFDFLREQALEVGLAFYGEAHLAYDPVSRISTDIADERAITYSDSEASVRLAVLLRQSLDRAAEEFLVKNPDRWSAIWMPLHALSIAICDTLAEGARRNLYKRVSAEITLQLEDGTLCAFRPW